MCSVLFGGIRFADAACIVSRSPGGSERMIAVFVEVLGAFDRTISERKTETVFIPTSRALASPIVFNAVR